MSKKIVVAIILIFFCGTFCYGQVSEGTFDKSVDLFNCRVVGLSVKESEESAIIFEKYQQEFRSCENATAESLKRFLTESTNFEDTIKLSSEINSLKQSYIEGQQPDKFISLLTEEAFNNKARYPLLFNFAKKRQSRPQFQALKADLKTELTKVLGEQQPSSNANTTNNQNSINSQTNANSSTGTENSDGYSFSLWWLLYFFVLLIAATVIFLVVRKLDLFDSIPSRRKRKTPSYKPADGAHQVQFFRDSTLKEIRDNSNQIKNLEKVVNSLKYEVQQLKSIVEQSQKSDSSPTWSNPPKPNFQSSNPEGGTIFGDSSEPPIKNQSSNNTFYLPAPDSEGWFKDEGKHINFTEGKSIYKFSKVSEKKANFEIDSHEAAVKLALNYTESIIDPACEPENAVDAGTRQIKTIKHGVADLHDGRWKVSTKAVIKYEH